jgi:hypothetical protein
MNSSAGLGWPLQTWWAGSLIGFHTKRLNGLIGINSYQGFLGSLLPCRRAYEQNPQSARRNNVPGEQISRRFLLLSGNLSASNYPGPASALRGQPRHLTTPGLSQCLPITGSHTCPESHHSLNRPASSLSSTAGICVSREDTSSK